MKKVINLSEKNLGSNLYELSREVVHDLFVVCRKAGIYTVKHPMVKQALSKPFFSFQKVFQFKKYFSLVIDEGDFFANNILIKDTGVSDFFRERMHDLEISTILFEDSVAAFDLEVFIDRFVKRVAASSPDYFMDRFLECRKVDSIMVNDELGQKIFQTGLRYRNTVGEDLSVRRLAANYFSGDIELAIAVMSTRFENSRDLAAATGIDYHVDLVRHILPEKFSQLPVTELLEMGNEMVSSDLGVDEKAQERLQQFLKACEYHPRRDDILENIRQRFIDCGIDEKLLTQSLSGIGSVKLEAAHAMDEIYNSIFSENFQPGYYDDFRDAFIRLIRTRQMGKAAGLTEVVVEKLASDSSVHRQHAIYLLEDIIKAALAAGEYDFLDVIIRHTQALFTQGRETFEFSQVVSFLLKSMLSLRRYEPVAGFLEIIGAGRKLESGATVYDSVTVKRIFDDLDDVELINRLVSELQLPRNNQIASIRKILVAIPSEQVAMKLAEIVTHPERSIRQHSLKILAELGWPAVTVFSDILRDEEHFLRPEDRYELPDKQWFLVRNAIFVLGNLGDPAACDAMRLRLADPDVRVRRELVSALEKIGGEAAADLLMILCDDFDSSVREAAIIALGLFRRKELTPFYLDLMARRKSEINRIITAIGMTRAEEGIKFLSQLLEDKDALKNYASGKASVRDIREMIIRTLERAGEEESGNTGTVPEIVPEENSTLGKTAKIILSKFYPRK